MNEERKVVLEKFDTSFNLPDVINVRTILAFQGGLVVSIGKPLFILDRWKMIKDLGLIENWQSELWPDFDKDILESEDPKVGTLVIAAVNAVLEIMRELQSTPKK